LFLITVLSIYGNQDSVAGIETGQQAGRLGFRIPEGKGFFSPPKIEVQTGFWGSTRFLFNEYRGSFLGAKRPGCEVDSSPPKIKQV